MSTHPTNARDPAAWVMPVIILAVGELFAWTLMSYVGWAQQGAWPSAAIPFVLNRVLLIHLALSLPIAYWLAWQGVARMRKRIALVGTTSVIAGLLFGAALWAARHANVWNPRALDEWPYHVVRLALAFLMMFPWCIAAASVARLRGFTGRPNWMDGLIAALVLLVPVIHVQQLTRRQSQVITDLVMNQRYAEALELCQPLELLGQQRLGSQRTSDVLRGLADRVESYHQQVATPLSSSATASERIDRSRLLFGLGRYADVRTILEPLAASNQEAAIRLGLVCEAEQRYDEAADRYRTVIDALADRRPLDEQQLRLLRIAFERRVNNLRRINDSRTAESELLAGLDEWPEVEAAMRMQIGLHYRMAGRTREAVEYFRRAVELDPRLEPNVDAEVAAFRNQASGCGLRPKRAVTR